MADTTYPKKPTPEEVLRNQRHRFDAMYKAIDQLNDEVEEVSQSWPVGISEAEYAKREQPYAEQAAAIRALFVRPEDKDVFERFRLEREAQQEKNRQVMLPGGKMHSGGKLTKNADGTLVYEYEEEDENDIATAWGDKPSKPGWAGQELRMPSSGLVVASSWRDPKKVNKQIQEAAKAAQAAKAPPKTR